MIEVELRGLMTKQQHNALIKRLAKENIKSEADNKESYFFDFPEGIFKVCDEIAKSQAKISLKIGDESSGALEEMEIPISRKDVPAALKLFAKLGYSTYHHIHQERTNYFLETATLSLKYTPDFKHHFELEGQPLEDASQIEQEKQRLKKLCKNYNLTPMEPEEITKRVKKIKKRLGFTQQLPTICEHTTQTS